MAKEEKEIKDDKKKQQKKPSAPSVHAQPRMEEKPGFKGIVRIAGKDVKGHIKLNKALRFVRGIGSTVSVYVAHIIEQKLGISPMTPVGELGDENID